MRVATMGLFACLAPLGLLLVAFRLILYASRRHVAALLTVAETLRSWKSLHIAVVLLFQPAEEGLHGARLMVEEGCLKDVVEVYGIHLLSTMPLGQIGVSAGPVMANSDRFHILVKGRGGHGSSPHISADPVLAASLLIAAAQQVSSRFTVLFCVSCDVVVAGKIVSRNVDPGEPAVVSFCGVTTSSNVANVIPESATLIGTVRCYSTALRGILEQRLRDVCAGVAVSSGVTIECTWTPGYNAVVNDEQITRTVAAAAQRVGHVVRAPVFLGGEDFCYYLACVPGCFVFVGCAIDDGVLRPHHSPEFDFDEKSLSISVKLFLQLVRDRCVVDKSKAKL